MVHVTSDLIDVGSPQQLSQQNSPIAVQQGSDGDNSEYESIEDEEEEGEEEHGGEQEGEGNDALNGSQDDKQLDDDEDRKNPQYIPKKGTFYEHDDRTMPGEEEDEPKETEKTPSIPEKKETRKKMWKENDAWQHDRYNLDDQTPKSKDELVTMYGYDIRDEDGPPRARRRRRYGRGPNKYTRNWEDLDAYSKQQQQMRGAKSGATGRDESEFRGRWSRGRGRPPGVGVGRGKRPTYGEEEEEFPALPNKEDLHIEDEGRSKMVNRKPQQEMNKFNTANTTMDEHQHRQPRHLQDSYSPIDERPKEAMRGGPGNGRPGFPRRGSRNSYRGYNRQVERHDDSRIMSNNRYGGGGDIPPRGRGGDGRRGGARDHLSTHKPQPMRNSYNQHRDMQDFTDEIKSMTITSSKEEYHFKSKRGIDNRRNTIPPRLQETMRSTSGSPKSGATPPSSPMHQDASSAAPKPKRYSSQRQRGVQEPAGYQNQQGYFEPNSSEHCFQNNLYENTPPQTVMSHVTNQSATMSLGGSGPPSFVPPSFTTAPATYPPEPFLRQTPPRVFPPVTQPHIIGPVTAGPPPPLAAATPVPPPVTGPAAGVPGPPIPPVTGPPFLPPENMLNYGAPVVPPPPPQFQPFQAFTPVSQGQPQEIYSNGVMYYNTQNQQYLPRAVQPLQKRPKAAIPIVPPPESGSNLDSLDEGVYKEYCEQYNDYEDAEEYNEAETGYERGPSPTPPLPELPERDSGYQPHKAPLENINENYEAETGYECGPSPTPPLPERLPELPEKDSGYQPHKAPLENINENYEDDYKLVKDDSPPKSEVDDQTDLVDKHEILPEDNDITTTESEYVDAPLSSVQLDDSCEKSEPPTTAKSEPPPVPTVLESENNTKIIEDVKTDKPATLSESNSKTTEESPTIQT